MTSFERSFSCAAVILAPVSFGCLLGISAGISTGCAERPPSPEGEGGPSSGAGASAIAKGTVEGAGAVNDRNRAEGRKTGEAPSPGRVPGRGVDNDPRAVFLAAQKAMKTRDFGLLFDLLSGEVQERFHADLKADAETSAGVPFVKDVLGFDPRECVKLSPREAFVKVMNGGIAASERFAKGVGAEREVVPQMAGASVVEVKREAESGTATVTVEYENGPLGRRRGEVKLVLEDGKWKLAELPQ